MSSGFWTDTDPATMSDPKRKFRFTVEFTNIENFIWYAKTTAKPSFQIATAEHKYLNHTFYYPGSVTWQDVSVTMVDPGDPDVAATLSDMLRTSGYKVPAGPTDDELGTMSKSQAVAAVGAVIVTQLDAEGTPIEKWTLHNAFITEIKYGELEYGGDDLTEYSVTFKYDWASLGETGESALITGTGPDGSEYFSLQ
jgi:hypothetical protein